MNTHNLQDKKLIESLCPNELSKFCEWFEELNKANSNRQIYGDEPLEVSTGIICWFEYFAKGYSPQAALDEDLACGA